jgi:hypothetical protein
MFLFGNIKDACTLPEKPAESLIGVLLLAGRRTIGQLPVTLPFFILGYLPIYRFLV